jgi:hypothetical protein
VLLRLRCFISAADQEWADVARLAAPRLGIRLEKALWTNIAELRIAGRRPRYTPMALAGILTLVVGVVVFVLLR